MPTIHASWREISFLALAALALLVSTDRPRQTSPSRAVPQDSSRPAAPSQAVSEQARAAIAEGFGNLPLTFEPNNGQMDPRVRFAARAAAYSVFLTDAETILSLHGGAPATGPSTSARAVTLTLAAGTAAAPVAERRTRAVSHYFYGNDADRWQRSVPRYQQVRRPQVYPGVDVVYYGNGRQLEYDFVVSPTAKPDAIRLEVGGVDGVQVASNGDLVLQVGEQQLRQLRPVAYQGDGSARRAVDAEYRIEPDGRIGFTVGDYDATQPLIIDPVLAYVTYLGGTAGESINGIAVDTSGAVYVAGTTGSSDFPFAPPRTVGQFGASFIAKLNAGGTDLEFATYISGSFGAAINAIAVDATGIYVTGTTQSADFPFVGGFDSTLGQADAFVTKFTPDGGALIYSSFLGGSVGRDEGWDIAVDASGAAHVVGNTASSGFPLVNSIHGDRAGEDGFIAKVSPTGSSLLYSTYLGGNGEDRILAVALGPSNEAHVAGLTTSTDFPVAAPFQGDQPGMDGFVAKIPPSGLMVTQATYLGGNGDDHINDVAVDDAGNAYVVGSTGSGNFPLVNPIAANGDSRDCFVSKLAPMLDSLLYSTYLPALRDDFCNNIAVDRFRKAYISGSAFSPQDLPVTDPIEGHVAGGAYVARLKASGALEYLTFLRRNPVNASTSIHDLAINVHGEVLVGGGVSVVTESEFNFATPGAFDTTYAGAFDGFIAKLAPRRSLSVASGSSGGGTPVLIRGIDVVEWPTVTFGGISVPTLQIVDDATVLVRTPSHSVGTVDVTVIDGTGVSFTFANAFAFVAPPTSTSISPSSGPSAGGTPITIMGGGFVPGATVVIGGAPARDVVVTSASTLTAVTGPGTRGVAEVAVINPDGGDARHPTAFTYLNTPPVALNAPLVASAGRPSSTSLRANDYDGDSLTYAVVDGGVKGTTVLLDGATGAFTYTPTPDSTGPDVILFSVADGLGGVGTGSIAVDINSPSSYLAYRLTFGNVQVIDAATATLVANVPLSGHLVRPAGPTSMFIVSAAGGGTHTLRELSTETHKVVRTVSIAAPSISDMAIPPAGDRAYISRPSGLDAQIAVSAVDLESGLIVDTVATTAGGSHVVVAPDGQRVYAQGHHRVVAITTQPLAEVASANYADGSRMAASSDSKTLYVASAGGQLPSFDILDAGTLTVRHSIPLSDACRVRRLVVAPDDTTAFVIGAGALCRIDLASGLLAAEIPAAAGEDQGVGALTPDGKLLLMSTRFAVRTINTDTNAIFTSQVPAGDAFDIAIAPAPRQGVFIAPASVSYRGTTTVSATLVRHGLPLSGRMIEFSLFGTVVGTATTTSGGVATLAGVTAGNTPIGSYPDAIQATFAGDASAPASSRAGDLTIVRAVPVLSWMPAPLLSGTPLTEAQLNATATTTGSFNYSPGVGTILSAGLHVLTVTFTPDDPVNYTSASTSVRFVVNLTSSQSAPVPAGSIPYGGQEFEPVADMVRGRLYIADQTGRVQVLSAATHTPIRTLAAPGAFLAGVAVNANADRAYASDYYNSKLWVFDTETGAVLEGIELGWQAGPVAVNPATGYIYAGLYDGVAVVDPDPAAPQRFSIVAGGWVRSLAVNTTTNLVYAGTVASATLRVIEGDPARPAFSTQIASIPVGGYGYPNLSIAVNRAAGHVYVADVDGNAIRIVDGDRSRPTFNAVIQSHLISGQPEPWMRPVGLAYNGTTNVLYAYMFDPEFNGSAQANVSAFDVTSGRLLSLSVLPYPEHTMWGRLAVNASTGNIYATNGSSLTTVLHDAPVLTVTATEGGGVGAVTVQTSQVAITYSDVTATIQTTVEPILATDLDLQVAGQFDLSGAQAYEITVDNPAALVAPITLCFNVASVDDPAVFASLRVLHGEGGSLIDRTSSRDFATGTICATVDSLSPFVIVRGARGAVQQLLQEVNAAAAARALNKGQNTSLTAKLGVATQQLDRGNTAPAYNQLQAFIAELQALVAAGRVQAAVATPLIQRASAIAASL